MEETSDLLEKPDSAVKPDVPMTGETPFISTFETGKRYQVHHTYIWLSPLASTFAVTAAAVVGFIKSIGQWYEALKELGYSGAGFIVLCVLGALLVIYAIFVVIHVFAYRNLSFVFDEKEFSLYSGIITKKRVHIPYARVQSVNHRSNIAQRLFGLCSVSIDTAGGAANKAVWVPYVSLGVGERIRADLFMRKAAATAGAHAQVVYRPGSDGSASAMDEEVQPDGRTATSSTAVYNAFDAAVSDVGAWRGAWAGGAAEMAPVSYEIGLNNKELALTTISHGSTATLAAVAGAAGVLGVIVGQLGLVFFIFVLVFGWISGMARIALGFGGFHARRRGDRIEVERGLLQREFSGIDVDRIQSVIVRQSFIRRCMGYCEVSLGRVDTAGDESSKNSGAKLNHHGLIVHPFIRLDRVDALVAGLIPEFAEVPTRADMAPLPPISLRRAIMRRCIWRNGALWTALCVAVLHGMFLMSTGVSSTIPLDAETTVSASSVGWGFIVTYIVCAVVTVFLAVSAVLWKKGSGFAFDRGYVVIRNDGLTTALVIVPRQKVQSGATRDNPFQRHAGVTSIIVTTAAGVGGTSTRLWDVRAEEGADWLDWVEPRGNGSH